MKVYRCANNSNLNEEFFNELALSDLSCKGIRKKALLENKIVKFDQPHIEEKKRSATNKNKSKIIKEREEKIKKYYRSVSKSEHEAQVISANKLYKKNFKSFEKK